jgi:hypothetical protein
MNDIDTKQASVVVAETEAERIGRKLDIRRLTCTIENQMRTMPGVKIGDSDLCPLKHTFVDGAYVREIFMPKGTLIVSKIHKITHPYFILKGEVSVLTEDGVERIKAPFSGVTKAGTKRVLYIHEDCTWITVHVTQKTDLAQIEGDIIAKDFDEIGGLDVNKFIGDIEKVDGKQESEGKNV